MIFSNIEFRVKRAGPSGLGDMEVTEYNHRTHIHAAGRSRERTAHLSTWQRQKQVPLTCYYITIFI